MENEIKSFAVSFFDKLGVEINSLEVEKQADDIFYIKIDTPDSGLLIGTHGSTFEAIQNIFRNIFSHKYDTKIKLHLEINDYIHNKDAKLFSFIDKKIEQLKDFKKDIKLPYLNPYERKKVHSYIAEKNDKSVETESRGEAKERRLYLIYTGNSQDIKSSSLDIDIDSIDI